MSEDFVVAIMAAVMASGNEYSSIGNAVRDARVILRETREQLREAAKADMANGLGLRAAS
jgi:hypothetical protein